MSTVGTRPSAGVGDSARSAARVRVGPDPAAFRELGYARVPGFISSRSVHVLRRAVDELVAQGASLTADATIRGARYRVQGSGGGPHEAAVAPGVFRKIIFPHAASRALARFIHDERLMGPLRALGLAEPECVVDQVNPKAPEVGTGFPWHQDTYFLPWFQRERAATAGGVNAVLALDAADAGNGALEVLPGSHRLGPVRFPYDTAAVDLAAPTAPEFDVSRRVLLEMAPGDALFFHPWLVHGSGPNRSTRPRRFLTWWFVERIPRDAAGRKIVR